MLSIILGNSFSKLSRMTNEWDNRNAYQFFIVLSIKGFFFSPEAHRSNIFDLNINVSLWNY